MNKKASSLVLTPFLLSIALICFFWATNAHMYQPDSLVVSFLVIAAMAAVLAAICFAIRFCWDKSGLDRRRPARLIAGVAAGAATIILLNTVFREPIVLMWPEDFGRRIFRGIVFLLIFSLFFFRLRRLTGFLNVLFLASICLSIFTAAMVFLKDRRAEENLTGDDLFVAMEKTPNIYLFWLESFSEPRVIDKYYGTSLVRDGFPGELEKRGFQYFEGTYTNNSYTLMSMTDFFSMQLRQNREAGMLDVSPRVRKMLGGSDDNAVLKILKGNGYFTAFITHGGPKNIHGGNRGPNLDSTDYMIPAGSLHYYLRPLQELNRHRMQWLDASRTGEHDMDGGYSGSLLERVRHAMRLAKDDGKPLFVSFQGGARHTDFVSASGEPYTWRQKEEWLPEFRDSVESGISQAMEIIDMIVENDPDAVIILMGDHGPWRLRGIWDTVATGDLKALSARLREDNESLESLADDVFSVLLAIRVPGYDGDISQGFVMSTVNVFRHVFAAINNNPALLENRQPNLSRFVFFGDEPFVVEGKTIQEKDL